MSSLCPDSLTLFEPMGDVYLAKRLYLFAKVYPVMVDGSPPVGVFARGETAGSFYPRVAGLRVLGLLAQDLPSRPPTRPNVVNRHPRVIFVRQNFKF